MRSLLICLLFLASRSFAQYTNRSSVLDGSGTTSSGGGYTNISAAGQPGGIAESAGGAFINQAGFLNTFFLRPALDTDGDGLADEADTDNDGDTLADATEINGGAFNPDTPTDVNRPDSDEDGMSDGQEAVSGTNPTNRNELLAFVSMGSSPGGRDVAWRARGHNEKTYVVRTAPDAGQPYAAVVFSNTVAGGAPPWYVVTNTLTDASPAPAAMYSVEVHP